MCSDDGVISFIGKITNMLKFAMLMLGPFVSVPEAYVMDYLTFNLTMTDAHINL